MTDSSTNDAERRMDPEPADPFHVQVLLCASARHPEGVARVTQALAALGLDVTTTGRATVSARADAATARRIFGADRSSAEIAADVELPVPETLTNDVESVTLAPNHVLMGRRHQREDE